MCCSIEITLSVCLLQLSVTIKSSHILQVPYVRMDPVGTNVFYRIVIPPANEVWGYIGITPSVYPSVHLSRVNITLTIIFLTDRDKAFILRMWIPSDKTFLSVPKFLIL